MRIPTTPEKIGHIYRVIESCITMDQCSVCHRWIENVNLREPVKDHLKEHAIAKQVKIGSMEARVERRRKEHEEHRDTSDI